MSLVKYLHLRNVLVEQKRKTEFLIDCYKDTSGYTTNMFSTRVILPKAKNITATQ